MASGTDGSSTTKLGVPERPLEREELERLAQAIGAREDLWRPLVRHQGTERHFEPLEINPHVGVWVISWMPGNDTGFHDHDGSSGGVAVAEGELREERPLWGREPFRADHAAGGAFSFGPNEIHRMANVSSRPCVTIHAYSPPLRRMGMYRVEDGGSVRRHGVDWDEELQA